MSVIIYTNFNIVEYTLFNYGREILIFFYTQSL
jgi:hypothetical protein